MAQAPDEQQVQLQFWRTNLQDPTYKTMVERMLLDPTGETYSDEELTVLLGLVPELPADSVLLELGAGSGRVTPHLARKARRVVAYDFMPEFIEDNRSLCASLGLTNVEHVVADAALVEWPPASADMVFANWLLMYLPDEAARAFVARSVSALRPGGYLFVHESCGPEASGDPDATYQPYAADNPARYRHPNWYEALLRRVLSEQARETGVFSRHDLTPLYRMDDPSMDGTQIAWLVRAA